jgi:hypothetical protein
MELLVLLLLVLALVCFLVAASGRVRTPFHIGWLGAALVTLTLLLGSWPGG